MRHPFRLQASEQPLHWSIVPAITSATPTLLYPVTPLLATVLSNTHTVVNKVRRGILNMPLVMKLKLLDRAAYASVREKVLAVLPTDLSVRLQEMNDHALKDSAGRRLRVIPVAIAQLLLSGEERGTWNCLLDEARERYGTDQHVGQLIAVARAGVSQLAASSKVELLDKLDYRVSDELLMSLLRVDGYNYLREKVN